MKAMILAAGRGERMRPLTDTTPKPLLSLGDESLIERHLRQLAMAGFDEIIINHAWLGECIEQTLGNGQKYGVRIVYSPEPEGGLETAGGIATALPLLGDAPFLVVNGDILTNFDFQAALPIAHILSEKNLLAHLWLTENPPHHSDGDFAITANGYADTESRPRHTFSGIAVYHPAFFTHIPRQQKHPLAPFLRTAIHQQKISASLLNAYWLDVGTSERLQVARLWVQSQ